MRYVRFYGDNNHYGIGYEKYVTFENDVTIKELNEYSHNLYYENIPDCGRWEFVTREEYEENN